MASSSPHPYPQSSRPNRSKTSSPTTGEAPAQAEKDVLSFSPALHRSGQTSFSNVIQVPQPMPPSSSSQDIYPPISTHTPPIVSTYQPPMTTVSSSSSTLPVKRTKLEMRVSDLTQNQTLLAGQLTSIMEQMTKLTASLDKISLEKGKGRDDGDDDNEDELKIGRAHV